MAPQTTPPAGPTPRFTSFTMILPAFNEEARIERVLEYYRPFARIIVIDNFSTDRTVELAEGLGAKVVRFRNQGTGQSPEWTRYVTSLADTDYLAFLSCSEHLPVPLLERYDEVARTGSADSVSSVRRSWTCGEFFPFLWGFAPRVSRLVNRRAIDHDAVRIHDAGVGGIGRDRTLELPDEPRWLVTHLRDADALTLVAKHSGYARVEALHRLEDGERLGGRWLWRALFRELKTLVRMLLRGGRSRVALREIWARAVMHSVIYWVAWEIRTGKGLDYSRAESAQLWDRLVQGQSAPAPSPSPAAPRAPDDHEGAR